jgi:hypothetical protein
VDKSPKEMLDQVERECLLARDGASRAEGVLGIAAFDLAKSIKQAGDDGELHAVQKQLTRAREAASCLQREITAVEVAVEVSR